MRIDAHAHLWRYDPQTLHWIEPGSTLAQDRLLEDLEGEMSVHGVDAAILVQASSSREETDWLLTMANGNGKVAGVVGWVELAAPEVIDDIALLQTRRKLIGLRHQVQDEPDGFLARPDVIRGVKACVEAGLTYDILVFARQATEVAPFLDRVGEGRFVLDHGAKPPIAASRWRPWAEAVREVAARPNVWCKVSGLITEAEHSSWHVDQIYPYLDHILECFGPERLIFGSDWPVCTLAASYGQVAAIIEGFVASRCPKFRDGVWGGHAKEAYGLE